MLSNVINTTKCCPVHNNMKFIDIGAILLNDMYNCVYRWKERHATGLDLLLECAFNNSVLD